MNTISTFSYRRKYRIAALSQLLRKALVAEKICRVDRGNSKRIDSPYSSQPVTTVAAIAGTYSTAGWTLTDDILTVADELIVAEHVYSFEQVLTAFDVFANRIDEQNYSVAAALDKWVLNELCEEGTGAYTTPAGGFTTPANINKIVSDLTAKVAGYSNMFKGLYLVLENTDISGIMQSQMSNGFSFADSALKNGFFTNYGGIEIYVVRTGTFVDATTTTASGTKTWTNDGHRLFGVKGVATYAAPRGLNYEEKAVAGKTGREIFTEGLVGFKAWFPKKELTVDITLA